MLILLFIAAFNFNVLYDPAVICLWLLLVLCLVDGILLLRHQLPINAWRVPKHLRLSNGDINDLTLNVQNFYPFEVKINIIDELPFQFQIRDFNIGTTLKPEEKKLLIINSNQPKEENTILVKSIYLSNRNWVWWKDI